MRSNYGTASLGASVGSPPGRAVCELVLAYAEPFLHWQRRSRGPLISLSAYASSSCGDWPSASQRLDLSLPSPPAHPCAYFVQGVGKRLCHWPLAWALACQARAPVLTSSTLTNTSNLVNAYLTVIFLIPNMVVTSLSSQCWLHS